MISPQTIQQILSRVDIMDIVGSFVKLKKRGTNYLGLCPFHHEKSPSFTVSPAKEIYKCFGCGKSGNSISFLMEHEKYSYVEALRWLANRYQVEIEETQVSDEVRQQQQVADSLYILNQFAQKYFSQFLWEAEEGLQIGYSYLQERGFTDEIIRKFQLGYAPDQRDTFVQTAIQQQYNPDLLQKSGLAVFRNEMWLDNYRGRIIFPIHNNTGKVIGFGARIIKKNDRAPKYINTPENELYVKSKILYGSYFARHAIDKADECLLVEGYTDVISLHQAGIENVVASGGTALTPDQLRLIKKYTNNLTIIYDGDGAGIKAALRGLELALEERLHVQLVLIPDKEDPDSYVRKVGTDAFRQFITDNKKDFILFQLEVALKDAGNDPQRKSQVVNQMAETIAKINKAEDFTLQQDYIRQCADLLKIEEVGLTNLVNKYIRDRVQRIESKQQQIQDALVETDNQAKAQEHDETLNLLLKNELQERNATRALLEFGLMAWDEEQTVAQHMFEQLALELFDNAALVDIIQMYRAWYEAGLNPTPRTFLYHEDTAVSGLVISMMDAPHEISPRWKENFEVHVPTREESYKLEVVSSLRYLQLRKIKRMIDENQRDMEKPQSQEAMMILLHTHQHLKQMEKELMQDIGTVIVR
jgi:DNA primase